VTVKVVVPGHGWGPLGETLAATVPSGVAVIVSKAPQAASDAVNVMVCPTPPDGNVSVVGLTISEPVVTKTLTCAVPPWSSLMVMVVFPTATDVMVNVTDPGPGPDAGATVATPVLADAALISPL